MGRHYQILWPLFSLFLGRVDLTDIWPLEIPVKVVKVYDGDTVLVRYKRQEIKVRLLKVDAPEKGQLFFKGEADAGMVAKKCFERLLQGEYQNLKIYGQDIYGRILGELGNLSFQAIKEGCATLYPYTKYASKNEKLLFMRTFSEARRLRKGIWNYSGFKQPKIWRKLSKRNVHQRSRR